MNCLEQSQIIETENGIVAVRREKEDGKVLFISKGNKKNVAKVITGCPCCDSILLYDSSCYQAHLETLLADLMTSEAIGWKLT
jgi:hypothetical protein